jgi:arylsulfatase A-like enzyme
LLLFLAGLGGHALAATPAKPNILFIAVDDLRPQLGCYGEKQIVSPNIDRLAETGVLFSRAYCQVPVCGASRASILTGLRPLPDRFIDYHASAEKDAPGIIDLPSWLKRQGYETFSMGKIYHHTNDNANSWSQLDSPLITEPYFPDYRLQESRAPAGTPGWGGGLSHEAADLPEDDYHQGQLAKAAIARLQAIKQSGKPGFLAVGFTKPHLPFVAPKKYWDLYKREELVPASNPFRPKNAPDQAMHEFNELRHYRDIPAKGPLSPKLALTLQHGYYACVSFTDAMIGRVLNELDRLGMAENTIVILWGDHGFQLGEHALWCKHANFNTSLNVPLIIRAPSIPNGARTPALVELVDLYPTLCELAGVPAPNHLEGSSLVPLLRQPKQPWKEAVFARYHGGESVRTDRYFYTEWSTGGNVVARMLYDHQTDPMENINIVDTPEGELAAAKLSGLLKSGWAPIAENLSRSAIP